MLKIDLSLNSLVLQDNLKKILQALDSTVMLDEAGALLLNRIRTRFLAETDPFGVKWIPSQAAIRRRKKKGTGTLFRSGRLFHSIQLAGSGPNERVIKTDVPYGKHHQFGTPKLPVRMFLGFNDPDARAVERLLQLRLNKILGLTP